MKSSHELAKELLSNPDGPIEVSVDCGGDAAKRCWGTDHVETIKHNDGWIMCFDGEIN